VELSALRFTCAETGITSPSVSAWEVLASGMQDIVPVASFNGKPVVMTAAHMLATLRHSHAAMGALPAMFDREIIDVMLHRGRSMQSTHSIASSQAQGDCNGTSGLDAPCCHLPA